MTDVDERAAAQIAQLRRGYVAQLPARVREIAAVFDGWCASRDATQLFQCYRLIHSLAGSAGIYGFGQLSAQARHLELCVKPAAESRRELDADQIKEVRGQLAALGEAVLAPT